MANSEIEIVVDDPTAPEADSPAVTSSRTVEIIVSLLLLALAALLGYDNWRTGISWDSTGPQAGYFPFYLCVILAGASLYGIVVSLRDRATAETFVTRAQLRRVMQVFVPTLLFCLAMQFLGLYVASFLLTAGFMRFIGRIASAMTSSRRARSISSENTCMVCGRSSAISRRSTNSSAMRSRAGKCARGRSIACWMKSTLVESCWLRVAAKLRFQISSCTLP